LPQPGPGVVLIADVDHYRRSDFSFVLAKSFVSYRTRDHTWLYSVVGTLGKLHVHLGVLRLIWIFDSSMDLQCRSDDDVEPKKKRLSWWSAGLAYAN
jgi:hypothetical protein